MKVALLSDCYLPRLGGIEVQVHDLARHLVAAGHEVEAFTATPGTGDLRKGTEVIDGIPVHRLAIPLPMDLPVNPFAPVELHRRLRTGHFDVAHVHMGVVSPFSMDSVRVLLNTGIPIAVTWHCLLSYVTPVVAAMGFVRRWSKHGVALSAVSGVAAEPLHQMAGAHATVDALPNGIDVSRWVPGTPRAPDGTVRVVTAMRLTTRKRPVHLLRVIQQARQQAPGADIRLEVLGEGPLRGRMERWVAREDAADWVSLPGRLSRDELHRRYINSDLYISPAELESFGIAALEARTTGLPVVGPRRSGISEFITDGVNGLLSEDDDGMARAVACLAGNKDVRQQMRRHNETHEPEQSWPAVIERTLGEYERARRLRCQRG